MFKGYSQTTQEVTAAKTSYEKLIEFLEKKDFRKQAYTMGKDKLNLSELNIGDTEAKEIAVILKDNSTITWLYLYHNKIGDSGAKELAEMLKTNSTLTLVALVGNNIGDSGAKELAEMLKTNSALTMLNLTDNNIGESGAKELALMLKYNSTLKMLHLSYNNIGNNGAKELAEMLKDNSTITTLDLNYNNIGDIGTKALDLMLKDNSTITTLGLYGNQIGDIGAKKINKYLQRNKTIAEEKAESLNAEGNNLCSQEKYNEAIEKYKAAIQITLYKENKLYEENKAKAEKRYEEQQQSLKLKQTSSVINENKPADIKQKMEAPEKNNLANKADAEKKQEEPQQSLKGINEVLTEMINKLENASNIKENDKDIIQNNILNKIKKLEENNINLENIAKSMQSIINNNKITKGMLMDLEEEIDEIAQQQTVIDNHIRIDKLNIFQQIVAEINIKLQKDNTIATSNKSEMQNTINIIMKKVPTLTTVVDIEKITAIMKELTTGRITKGKLIDIEDEVEELILQHLNKEMNKITTWTVTEIIYDNPLLNHPKLLQAAVDNKLSTDLIHEAINNNDEGLILAGLMSMGYDVTTIE